MEPRAKTEDAPAVVEATEWMLLLHEEPHDGTLRRRFEAWRCASEANRVAWDEVNHVSDVASTMQPAYRGRWGAFVAGRQKAASPEVPSRFAVRRLLPLGLAAAGVALVIAMAGPALVVRLQADHVTATAEQRQIDLPDGSRIALAPASAVAVSYSDGQRRVSLLAGEAFFQVQPNVDRPFRVTAAGVETTVLGTSFDVRIQSDDVVVAVAEGKVQVTRSSGGGFREHLVAGQSVRVLSDDSISLGREDIEAVGSWRQGQLYAEGQSIGEAVEQLRRYFTGRIVISDRKLSERRVSGAFNLDDPEQALRGMAAAHGATVRRITPWLLVLSPS